MVTKARKVNHRGTEALRRKKRRRVGFAQGVKPKNLRLGA